MGEVQRGAEEDHRKPKWYLMHWKHLHSDHSVRYSIIPSIPAPFCFL